MNWTLILEKLDGASSFLTESLPTGIKTATSAARKALDGLDEVADYLASRKETQAAPGAKAEPMPTERLLALKAKCDAALATAPEGTQAALGDGTLKRLIASFISQIIAQLLAGVATPAPAA